MTKAERESGSRVRAILSTWHFWVGVSYLGFSLALVGVVFNYSKNTRDEAVHIAEIHANHQANINQCLRSRPTLKKINKFFRAVSTSNGILIMNSVATLQLTPKDDPLYLTRVANLNRLEAAQPALSDIKFPIPTKKQCLAIK